MVSLAIAVSHLMAKHHGRKRVGFCGADSLSKPKHPVYTAQEGTLGKITPLPLSTRHSSCLPCLSGINITEARDSEMSSAHCLKQSWLSLHRNCGHRLRSSCGFSECVECPAGWYWPRGAWVPYLIPAYLVQAVRTVNEGSAAAKQSIFPVPSLTIYT